MVDEWVRRLAQNRLGITSSLCPHATWDRLAASLSTIFPFSLEYWLGDRSREFQAKEGLSLPSDFASCPNP